MLSEEKILSNQDIIEGYLKIVNREGIENYMKYLRDSGFYTQAASTRHHQSYKGGLAEHSLEVMQCLIELNDRLNLGFDMDSIVIASIGHDNCKIDAYIPYINGQGIDNMGFTWNHDASPGHALKSIELINRFITLTDEEESAIAHHMGAYEKKEYDWNDLSEAYKDHKMAFYIHVADMRSTYGF